jgi:thioredoxin-dependent adenylylsulfate APS reductase
LPNSFDLLEKPETASAPEILAWATEMYGSGFAIATSFQREGMVIIDLAARLTPGVRVFTLDTGRLPDETYRMIETVRERYGIAAEIVQPDPAEVRDLIAPHGPDLFYESVDARRRCCEVRKVRPLERKLATLRAWATGIRRDQSPTRAGTPKVELDAVPVKINPLADWTAAQVEEYTRLNRVPEHPLYARGYASIGCAPCTRPIAPGEDARAGRWWWEQQTHKECGIHFGPDGTVRRAS